MNEKIIDGTCLAVKLTRGSFHVSCNSHAQSVWRRALHETYAVVWRVYRRTAWTQFWETGAKRKCFRRRAFVVRSIYCALLTVYNSGLVFEMHFQSPKMTPDPKNPPLGNFHGFYSYNLCLACFEETNHSPEVWFR